MDLLPWIPAVLGFSAIGCLAGFLTGLVPGFHANNLATALLLVKPVFFGFALVTIGAAWAGPFGIALFCAFLVAAVVSHGVAAFVPSVFLGAPGDASAVSVLPGHRLLREGRGHDAVAAAARGAILGAFASAALLLPLRWLMGPPVDGYGRAQAAIPLILAALVVVLILSEGRRRTAASSSPRRRQRLRAAALFLGSGALGWIVLGTDLVQRWNWFPLPGIATEVGSQTLLPLFTGLFGLSTLLLSARGPVAIPPQLPPSPGPVRLRRAVLSGSLAGAAVSWLPGLSSGAATSLAQFLARRREHEDDPVEFMAALGAVGVATNIFTVAALFIIQRARSGVAVAIRELVGASGGWADPGTLPGLVAVVLIAGPLSALLAYPLAVRGGRVYARVVARVPYRGIAIAVTAVLVGFVALFAGATGLVIAFAAVPLGILPPRWGVKRVHLMGALLVPVIAFSV